MIKNILNQMWHQRRSNGWIFVELILVTFFMWGVIDPVYVLLSNRAIDPGYDITNTYRLTLGEYTSNHRKFDQLQTPDSLRRENFLRIYKLVENYPGIEAAVITENHQYPLSSWEMSTEYLRDTLKASALIMQFYQQGDFFKVFGIRDVNTGQIPDHRNNPARSVYITEGMAKRLFPGENPVGMELFLEEDADTLNMMVSGIVPDFKFRSTDQPKRTTFIPSERLNVERSPGAHPICFRIKDGISPSVFAQGFKQELVPQLSIGNFYFLQLTSFDDIYKQSEFQRGVTNKLRLQIGLALFFLVCTFLGIAGTFWLRSDARRGEIGLKIALGRTRKGILGDFLTESWLLTTIAWLIGIIFVWQRVYLSGFAEQTPYGDTAYLQNRFVPHFLIVSFIVYLLLLAISFVGTWIPAWKASKISAASALKEE